MVYIDIDIVKSSGYNLNQFNGEYRYIDIQYIKLFYLQFFTQDPIKYKCQHLFSYHLFYQSDDIILV